MIKSFFHTSKKAFTLIELLIVITIVALIVALTLPSYELLQARAALQQGVDLVTETIRQARTFSTAGYEIKEGEGASVMGVRVKQGSNLLDIVAFEADRTDPANPTLRNERNVRSVDLGGNVIHEITADQSQSLPEALILFDPPFGVARSVSSPSSAQSFQRVGIRIGPRGQKAEAVNRTVDFFTLTARIEYDYDKRSLNSKLSEGF